MAKAGEHQRLRDLRLYFQYASVNELTALIERITGRKVRAFVSGMDTHQDVATEVFYLYPVGNHGGLNGNLEDELAPPKD